MQIEVRYFLEISSIVLFPSIKHMKSYVLSTIGCLALGVTAVVAEESAPKVDAPPAKPQMAPPSPEQMIKKLDKDGNGAISMEEFKAGKMAKAHPEKADERFKAIDKDGNGSLSKEELEAHKPKPPSPEERFKKIDKNGDGNVSLEEFKEGQPARWGKPKSTPEGKSAAK